MHKKIGISVRNVVEFVYRSGNIDSGYMSSNRAREGIRIHKKIQAMSKKQAKLSGGTYESEFSLKHAFQYKDYEFVVEGRADGILILDDKVSIEEIKSTTKDIDEIVDDPEHWHWAQAKCYGYMVCVDAALSNITMALTYCNVEIEQHDTFEHI